jgi:hypothetical protein
LRLRLRLRIRFELEVKIKALKFRHFAFSAINRVPGLNLK